MNTRLRFPIRSGVAKLLVVLLFSTAFNFGQVQAYTSDQSDRAQYTVNMGVVVGCLGALSLFVAGMVALHYSEKPICLKEEFPHLFSVVRYYLCSNGRTTTTCREEIWYCRHESDFSNVISADKVRDEPHYTRAVAAVIYATWMTVAGVGQMAIGAAHGGTCCCN